MNEYILFLNGRKISPIYENPFDNLIIHICICVNVYLKQLGYVTPNMITTVSFVFGLLAAYYIYTCKYILAVVLFFLAYVFDCMDGNYARMYNMVTVFGDWYDHITDVVKVSLVVIIIMLSNNITKLEKIIFLVVTILLSVTSLIQLGCQEKIYSKDNSQTLKHMQNLCNADPQKVISVTKWFGCGTLIMFIIGFLIYLGTTR